MEEGGGRRAWGGEQVGKTSELQVRGTEDHQAQAWGGGGGAGREGLEASVGGGHSGTEEETGRGWPGSKWQLHAQPDCHTVPGNPRTLVHLSGPTSCVHSWVSVPTGPVPGPQPPMFVKVEACLY